MRLNIRDIMKLHSCSEVEAEHIERKIDEQWLIDWSECSMTDIKEAIKTVTEDDYYLDTAAFTFSISELSKPE